MVTRYRNNTSILTWGMGNELNLQADGCSYSGYSYILYIPTCPFLKNSLPPPPRPRPARPLSLALDWLCASCSLLKRCTLLLVSTAHLADLLLLLLLIATPPPVDKTSWGANARGSILFHCRDDVRNGASTIVLKLDVVVEIAGLGQIRVWV